MSASDAPREGRRLAGIAVVLSFAAGATDAFAFLLLGGVFTANMTGNLILAGLTGRTGYPAIVVGVVVALIVFVLGLCASFRIARPNSSHARLVLVLGLGTLAQVAVLIGWLLEPDRTSMVAQAPLIACSAFAMSAQTAVSKRIESRSGVSTTYVTGTITSLTADLMDKKPQATFVRVAVVVALVIGALCGSVAISIAPALGAALPIVPAILGLVLLIVGRRRAPRDVSRGAGATK